MIPLHSGVQLKSQRLGTDSKEQTDISSQLHTLGGCAIAMSKSDGRLRLYDLGKGATRTITTFETRSLALFVAIDVFERVIFLGRWSQPLPYSHPAVIPTFIVSRRRMRGGPQASYFV